MVLVLRALAALIGLLLLVVLAAAGLAAAIFSLQAGDGTLSLSDLASLLSLDGVRDSVDNCIFVPNADQADRNNDDVGDVFVPVPGPARGSSNGSAIGSASGSASGSVSDLVADQRR